LLESDVEFVTAAEDVTDESWDAVGLTAGKYQYLVFGVNSRGQGPESGVATVPVLARAAAKLSGLFSRPLHPVFLGGAGVRFSGWKGG